MWFDYGSLPCPHIADLAEARSVLAAETRRYHRRRARAVQGTVGYGSEASTTDFIDLGWSTR